MRYAKTLLLILTCLLFSASAFAQNKKASKTEIKKALVLIQDANDDLANKDYKYALEGYKEAYGIYPTSILLYRMGLTYDKMENKIEAISHYQQYLASGKTSKKLKKKAQKRIKALEKILLPLVSLSSTPPGAQIFKNLDGEAVAKTPAKIELSAGKHTVHLKLEGYQVQEVAVVAEKEKENSYELTLAPIKAKKLLSMDEREVKKPAESEAQKSGIMTTLGWTSVGLGGALLVGGGVFTFLSSSKESEANDYDKRAPNASRAELSDLQNSATSFADLSTVFFISGGVLAATGIALIVLDGSTENQSAIRLRPIRGGASVGFSSRF